MRYLGVDYGTKRVGLALSDEAGTMGFPYAILSNTGRLGDELLAIIAEKSVEMVVIGDSRDFSGAPNPVAADARSLGAFLETRAGIPVVYEPEAFTSAEARRAPAKEMKNRSPRTHAPVDASAAALILTSYLSHAHE